MRVVRQGTTVLAVAAATIAAGGAWGTGATWATGGTWGTGRAWAAEASGAALPASVAMSYDDCLREIGATAGRLGVAPEIVEDRPGLHVVRFTTPAGRVVLGCSADAGYLAVATGS